MGQLIDDLLKLSRISRTQLIREPVDLSAMATRVAERLMSQVPDQKTTCHIAPNLHVKGEPNLIEVVLTNLFSNAFKFTSRTENPVVEFGETIIDNENTLFIRDNGVGFNLELATNLFGAFQRMHKQSEFPGTGIGLATVHRVVNLHQGKIWANSAPGQGATFYFTLNPPNLLI
jgi:light-regulated signal transduction histidine kinase (bacteriophytochrome)